MGIKTFTEETKYGVQRRSFHNFGGEAYFEHFNKPVDAEGHYPPMKDLKLLTLIWRLFKIFLRYGNRDMYYHICGSGGEWDVPMNAENVEVRLTACGPRVTIW